MGLAHRLKVASGRKFMLAKHAPSSTPGCSNKRTAQKALAKNLARLETLQYRLYAENKRALLIVLQGMDASGKDGAIRQVMSGLNPQGCDVTSFKVPTSEELDHDFLWRIHRAVPSRGDIGIFNRSHYEDVIVTRVHDLVPKPVWQGRFEQINSFERGLTENGVTIVKFFLHVGRAEQKKRLQERLDDPARHWKINPLDFVERKHWDHYMHAYEDTMRACSTAWAPWWVIPADHKWYRNLAISEVLVETLETMNPQFPKVTVDISKIKLD